MKKTSLILLTMIFAFSFFGKAQNHLDCNVNAKFEFKNDNCDVTFLNHSDAGKGTTIKSYAWNFGDNTKDTKENPKHVYAKSGIYNVCLTVVALNAAGKECKDNICRPVTVRGCGVDSSCRLNAKFDYKADSSTVTFKNASVAGIGAKISNWLWTFGDGTSSTDKDPAAHVYKTLGHYQVCLSIEGTNVLGKKCVDKTCHEVDLKGSGNDSTKCRLSAKFRHKTDSCTVSLTDSSKAGKGSSITSWSWAFGDGDSSNVKNPIHTYKKSGKYGICLTITGVNAAGLKCVDKECHGIFVRGCGNIIDSTKCKLDAEYKFKVKDCSVSFAGSTGATGGSKIISWSWKFGDGTSSNIQNPTHVYTHGGHFIACLTIESLNAFGKKCVDTKCHGIFVKGCGGNDSTKCKLFAKFDYKADSCTVAFKNASSSGPGTTITKTFWTFGDGDSSSVKDPIHTYKFSGHYRACLTLVGVNAAGQKCNDYQCKEIDIKGCGKDSLKCKISAKFQYTTDSNKVHFTDASVTGNGTTITKWLWNFGYGDTSNVKNPTHTFTKPGQHKVCLIVTGVNANGMQCRDMECLTLKTRELSNMDVYPNPANDMINISFNMVVEGQASVSVTDLQGRTLFTIKEGYFDAGMQNLSWNVGVPSGLYFLTLKSNAGIEHKQLFIQK